MSLGVSKDCFPDSSKCHNCERKRTEAVKKENDAKEISKRCGNCHLMTYCDADCQKEHWLKVHNKHCKFLSGKTPVKNTNHDTATCPKCIEERETTPTLINSENSPKTTCNVDGVAKSMKKALNNFFEFHGEGKKCSCSLEHGLQLPFALGEVSGQYLEIASTGLDLMMAHAFKIVKAMIMKAKDHQRRTALFELLRCLVHARALLWYDILVRGKPRVWNLKVLHDQVDGLRTIYGATDPWWKVLKFSVTFVFLTKEFLSSIANDSSSLNGPRFKNLKLMHDYGQCQLQNQAMVSEKKMWPNFLLWPQSVNGSLVVLLPPGTRCQGCNAKLTGETAITEHEANSLSFLLPHVGHNGALVVTCPPVQKSSCATDYLSKNVFIKMASDEDQQEDFEEECKVFKIEARDCDFCIKSSLSSHRCSACLAVQYCSLDCQKQDLDFHRTVCATWAKDDYRKLLGGGKQKKHWKKVFGE